LASDFSTFVLPLLPTYNPTKNGNLQRSSGEARAWRAPDWQYCEIVWTLALHR
jgi:hypothetical protein